jgi:protein TonB
MEDKKNTDLDHNRNSSLYFSIGLCLMLFVTYSLLNFKTYDKDDVIAEILEMNEVLEEDIPLLNINTPPPPPPPPTAAPEIIVLVEDVEEIEETVIESTETSQDDEIAEPLMVEDLDVEEFEEDIEVPFAVIENVPVYPGCKGTGNDELKKCFQENITKHIIENFKYPGQAIELGLDGKVYVIFVINSTGVVSRIRTRGPHKILENEASRIIKLLPKMEPGKQRGKAVNVPYSVPINFQYLTD